jgi:hypothetical protein
MFTIYAKAAAENLDSAMEIENVLGSFVGTPLLLIRIF